jgi:predicted ATPase
MSEDAGQDLSVSAEETADDERPSLRIESLEIDDLRSIKRLRWPEDGFGWNGRIPDIIVVGGANGSGKTTLLEEIFSALSFKRESKAKINIETLKIAANTSKGAKSSKLIYFKSKRANERFNNDIKYFNKIPNLTNYIYTWGDNYNDERPGTSIEELLFSARWEDLNAFMNGRKEAATKFNFYADEFERFTEGEKKLVWTDEGELLVETRDGVRHDVNEMSSGEHQALIFSIMLSRWWTPGSLILIDEPELHLHTHWQAKLLQRIIDLQKERGGQAILATQSSDLFSMAPAGSQVLLGGW